jgi:hypothetical protein
MAIDQIPAGLIKDDAITTAKIANSTGASDGITTAKIATSAITEPKIDTASTGIDSASYKLPVYANDAARNSAISSPAAGMLVFNTASTALQQYSGTAWIEVKAPPTISGLGAGQDGAINIDSTNVVTVNGGNFVTGMTVALCNSGTGATLTGFAALAYTLVSTSQITVTVPTGITLGSITSGTGHTNGTYYNVAFTDVGAGSGIEGTVTVASNAISAVTITDAGTGYGQTDVLGIPLGTGAWGTIGGSGTATVPLTRYYPLAAGTLTFIKVTNTGLSVNTGTIKVGADPIFAAPSNPLGTTFIDKAVPFTIGSPIQATMTTDGTLTYSIIATASTSTNTYTIDGTTGQISLTTSGGVNHTSGLETDVLTVRAVGSEDPTNQITEFYPVNINVGALATGGQYVATHGGYRYHRFNTNGNTTWNSGGIVTIEYLVVAGGGGGGRYYGSGAGGGGGLLWSGTLEDTGAVTPVTVAQNTNYTMTVGAKGAAADQTSSNGGIGSASIAFAGTGLAVTTVGGGYGNGQGGAGGAGGSGGGGCFANQLGGAGTVGQGHDGEYSTASNNTDAGGAGGGAGGPAYYEEGYHRGYNNTLYAAHGGPGLQISWATRNNITGSGDNTEGLFFAGGGAGGPGTGAVTKGGRCGPGGGGGAGRCNTLNGLGDVSGRALNNGGAGDATNGGNAGGNTGGGGGGMGNGNSGGQAGHGGNGIIVLRYAI